MEGANHGGNTALYCALKAGDAVVPFSVAAAKLCAHLAHWLGDTADPAHAPYPIPFEADLVREFVTWLDVITSEAPTGTSAVDDVAPKRQRGLPPDGSAFDGMDHNKLLDLARVSKWLDCEVLSVMLSSQMASRLRGLSAEQIRQMFSIDADMTPEEQESSLRESPETPPDAVVAPSPGVPPAPARSLSEGLGDDDAIMELLRQCDLKTIATLKRVSKAWRDRARRALTVKDGPWIRSLAHRSPFGARRFRFLLSQSMASVSATADPIDVEPSMLLDGYLAKRMYKEWRTCHIESYMTLQTTNVLSLGPYTDLFNWRCVFIGPADSPYEGGVFVFDMNANDEYPLVPPSVKFITPILHPNINEETGKVCLDILGSRWSPAYQLPKLAVAIVSLLFDPNFESETSSIDLAWLWREDSDAYRDMVREHTLEHATLDQADLVSNEL